MNFETQLQIQDFNPTEILDGNRKIMINKDIFYKTYLWKELPQDSWWRIQTRDPKVITKLNRRENVILCGWGINDPLRVYRIQFKSTRNARKSLARLTGQKVYKDAVRDEFYSKSIPILHVSNGGESDG